LKAKYNKVCHKYTKTTGKAINRFVYSKLLNEAWTQSMSMSSITGGFKTTGIYLVDRTAILFRNFKETTFKDDELSFIPLCSPMPGALEKPRMLFTFTEVELERFQERYQSKTTKNQVGKMYHPDQQIQEPVPPVAQ